MSTIKMVEVTRSEFIESTHYGAAILISTDGKILKECGLQNGTLAIFVYLVRKTT